MPRIIRNAYTRAHYVIEKFIGLYDIEYFYSNMRIDANGAFYYLKSKKSDFESRDMRHEENSKLVPQMMIHIQERVTKLKTS